METEKNEKFIKIFELNQKVSENRAVIYDEIGRSVNNIVKEFVKYGKEIEQGTTQYLQKYLDWIKIHIADLNNPVEVCQFLIKEKGRLNGKVIEAKINKNGYLEKDYQTTIDQIIFPLLKHYEWELEFEKKHPTEKTIVYKPYFPKQKTLEIPTASEIIKTNEKPVAEKNPPKITENILPLPDGFKQIECEATKEEILNYFMILTKEKNYLNDEFYMDEKDVVEFVKNNFSVFKCTPTGKYFSVNLFPKQKKTLTYFVCQFYLKYDRKLPNMKMKYAMLLINNLDPYKSDKPSTLLSNMSESKKPKKLKEIIPIKKYLSGKISSPEQTKP